VNFENSRGESCDSSTANSLSASHIEVSSSADAPRQAKQVKRAVRRRPVHFFDMCIAAPFFFRERRELAARFAAYAGFVLFGRFFFSSHNP
jgi:hypothetical protein